MKKSILTSLALSFIGILVLVVILSLAVAAAKPSEPVLKNLEDFLLEPIAYLVGGVIFGWYAMPNNALRETLTAGIVFAVIFSTISQFAAYILQLAAFQAEYGHPASKIVAGISLTLVLAWIRDGVLWTAWYACGAWFGHQQCERRTQPTRRS